MISGYQLYRDPRCWFLRLGLGCAQNDLISQQMPGRIVFPDPANNITFCREFTKGGLVKGGLAIYVLLLYYYR